MTRLAPPFHGVVTAVAFVLDVDLIGEGEARRRVLDRWVTGARLAELDGGRWLLVLAAPTVVLTRAAPGLPVQNLTDGELTVQDGGRPVTVALASLRWLDPASWLDLSALTVHLLTPVQGPAPVPAPARALPALPPVDMRGALRIPGRSGSAAKAVRELSEGRPARRGRSGTTPGDLAPRRNVLAQLVLRSPAATLIRKRHLAYLRQLTEDFERKNYEAALRDAISLGGAASGRLSLRMPSPRRAATGPRFTPTVASNSVPLGPTANEHLRELYRSAARELERLGRIPEAAFVYVDLLNQPAEAAALLERHGQFVPAARLAEGHRIDPTAQVRLWWRAGDRGRAVHLALRHGAFGAAVARLEQLDRDAGADMRAAWAAQLSRSGDHLGAVRAAWPVARLRPLASPDIAAGMLLGGPVAGELFAYQLALTAPPTAVDAATALVKTRDPELTSVRDAFLAALADLPVIDAAADRRICSEATRTLAGEHHPTTWDEQLRRKATRTLALRADPLLREDLPADLHRRSAATPSAPVTVQVRAAAGQLGVVDACPLRGGSVLVALGAHGLRLLGPDGRTRARWDVPAHQLAVAHHGGSAVIANTVGPSTHELYRLDVASRRLERWVVIRAERIVPTYDGLVLTIVDGGLVFLDVQAPDASVVWRELSEDVILQVVDGPGAMAAMSRRVETGKIEVWRWEMPGRTLRSRTVVDLTAAIAVGLLADGTLFQLDEQGLGIYGSQSTAERRDVDPEASLLTSGSTVAVITGDGDGTQVEIGPRMSVAAVVHLADSGRAHIRTLGERTVVWDDRGRLVLLDLAARRHLATTSTRA